MGLIVVDSSVWIDFLQKTVSPQTDRLRSLFEAGAEIGVADLVLFEVLQGTRDERRFLVAQAYFSEFESIVVCDGRVIVEAARNYRALRERGITVRKSIDTLIATRCILDRSPLLYADHDFDPFVEHLGLRSALDLATGVN